MVQMTLFAISLNLFKFSVISLCVGNFMIENHRYLHLKHTKFINLTLISFYFPFSFSVGIAIISFDHMQQALASNNRLPAYSLQNMPKTDFSCRGKILGGYYADADTQCQMFHICVKIAGVGVSCKSQ